MEYTQKQKIALDNLLLNYDSGKKDAILDRCYDRDFCRNFGLAYSEPILYTKIMNILNKYKLEKILENEM